MINEIKTFEDYSIILVNFKKNIYEVYVDNYELSRLHEEFHRIKLTQKGVNIDNGLYATGVCHDKRTMKSLHRFIMNAGPDDIVDHKHHKRLDNRHSELRLTTTQNNLTNKEIRSSVTINYDENRRKYRLIIKKSSKYIYDEFHDTYGSALSELQKKGPII